MEQAIEIYAIINFAILGLSHVVQHRAWAEFFIFLTSKGTTGAFANALPALIGGSLIVSFHNVWTGIPALLTAIGWGFVLKSAIVFLFPKVGLRSIARVRRDNSHLFCVPGVIMIAVACVLAYAVWERSAQAV